MDAKNDRTFTEAASDEAPDFDAAPDAQQQQVEEPPLKTEHVLMKPVEAHGEDLHVIKWREPTGGDIEAAGNPIYLDFSGPQASITFNEKKMAAMMSRLCAVPPSTIRQLSAKDWNAIAWALFRFFTPPGA